MLSRTAENLYWMARYMERSECTARLLEMGRRMTMLPGQANDTEWRSVVRASGCPVAVDHAEPFGETDAIRTLLLSPDNPSSIRSCIARARANGRAVRTALTQEMWEAINESWRRLETLAENDARRELPQILDWVKARSALLRGVTDAGMLRHEAYDFLLIGSYLERADMMLRLLDVKYYVLLPETEMISGGRDYHQWMSLLYATSSVRAYHHVYKDDYSPWKIADFLILNRAFPRSLAYSYARIGEHLDHLSRRYGCRQRCHSLAYEMISRLGDLEVGAIFQQGLHEFIGEAGAVNRSMAEEIGRAYRF